jgi:hypothetical protein
MSPVMESTLRLKTLQAEYDFAVDGGGTGTITMRGVPGDSLGNGLPAAATITGGYIDVETAVTSATGTVAIQAESAGDILAATGQAGLTVGRKSIIPAGTGATSVKTTVNRALQMVIATAALTAGKFRVVLFYK